jgi:GT2 family glycosyltransferase
LNGVSVVIPTRDRQRDLRDLLWTLLDQSQMPLEIIIVDDSPKLSARGVADSFIPKFDEVGCKLKYFNGTGDGLPAARNIGIRLFNGDAVLFIDDDTLLDQNVLYSISTFLRNKQDALGVQPILLPEMQKISSSARHKLENAIYTALMLTSYQENKLKTRRSGLSIFPSIVTEVFPAQRLSGCCCYKREVFREFWFDCNLKRWGFMEDLDFSYRVNKKYPHSLYVIPYAKIIHKGSKKARMSNENSIYMVTIYWFYVFFKVVFDNSALNLIAFLWGLTGYLVVATGGLILKKGSKNEWWNLIYLLKSYGAAFRNLRRILMRQLEFFNTKFG